MKRTFFPPLLSGLSLAMFMLGFEGAAHGDDGGAAVERIVCIRHGEKPAKDLGQLDCQGLNRALALPKVLISHYGKADFIFAPLTSPRITVVLDCLRRTPRIGEPIWPGVRTAVAT